MTAWRRWIARWVANPEVASSTLAAVTKVTRWWQMGMHLIVYQAYADSNSVRRARILLIFKRISMPFKDKTAQRKYQCEWMAKRRRQWFEENGPCRCGSWTELQLDHIDESTKVSHKIWSWSNRRREAELEKCQVLCRNCHERKTGVFNSRRSRHVARPSRRLSPEQIGMAVVMVISGLSFRETGRRLGVCHETVKRQVCGISRCTIDTKFKVQISIAPSRLLVSGGVV